MDLRFLAVAPAKRITLQQHYSTKELKPVARAFDEKSMIRYLLREVSETERQSITERIVQDEEFFLEVEAVEDELISAYVRNELSAEERQRFEKHFLATLEQRRRVEFSQALLGHISELDSQRVSDEEGNRKPMSLLSLVHRPTLGLAAILLCILALGGIWAMWEAFHFTADLRQLQAEHERLKQQALQFEQELAEQRRRNAQIGQLPQPGSGPTTVPGQEQGARLQPAPVLVVSLTPGLVRNLKGSARLIIPEGTELLRLRLAQDRPDDALSHRVTIRTTENVEVLRQSISRASRTTLAQPIVIDVPARLFNPGDYLVTLEGAQDGTIFADVADYHFRVREK